MSKKKELMIYILRFLPMVIMMVVIFLFSAMPGDESGETSGTVMRLVVGVFESLTHEDISPERQEQIHFLVRKIAHFTEFMILGMTAVLAFYRKERRRLANCLIPAAVSVLYAASDEFHQRFVPGRGPSLRDVCVDAAGVLTAVTLLTFILWIIEKRQKKSPNNR